MHHPPLGPRVREASFRRPTAAIFIAALAAGPAAAVDFSAVFAVKARSVYTDGPAVVADSGVRRIGPGPQTFGQSFGRVFDPCAGKPLIPSCATGAEAGADVSFNFGLNYAAKFNSGSFDAQYPISVRIDTPADFSNPAGDPFTLNTSFTVPGFTAPSLNIGIGIAPITSRLQAKSPTLEAFVDLDAKFNAFVGARACAVGLCTGPRLGRFDVDKSQTLAAINRNGDLRIVIGDEVVDANEYVTTPDGNLTVRLKFPNIDAQSSAAGGSTATLLQTVGRDNVIALGANVGNIVGNAIGIPLNGTIAGIGYGLLDVNAGLGLDLRQTLSLSITPETTFNFLSPVRQVLGDGTLSDFTRSITIPLGTELSLISNSFNLGVVPVTKLVARITNLTEIVVAGDLNIQALKADIYDFKIGPLYDSGSVNGGIFSIPIFTNSFDVDFGMVAGNPFNIRQGIPLLTSINPDPGFRAGFRIAGDDPDNAGVYRTEITALDLACPPTISCNPQYFADGSPVTLDDFFNFVLLSGGDAANLPAFTEARLGTDADLLAALYATGFTTERTALFAPPGLPRPPGSFVPEPASWGLLLAGFGIVGGVLRRRREGVTPRSFRPAATASR